MWMVQRNGMGRAILVNDMLGVACCSSDCFWFDIIVCSGWWAHMACMCWLVVWGAVGSFFWGVPSTMCPMSGVWGVWWVLVRHFLPLAVSILRRLGAVGGESIVWVWLCCEYASYMVYWCVGFGSRWVLVGDVGCLGGLEYVWCCCECLCVGCRGGGKLCLGGSQLGVVWQWLRGVGLEGGSVCVFFIAWGWCWIDFCKFFNFDLAAFLYVWHCDLWHRWQVLKVTAVRTAWICGMC